MSARRWSFVEMWKTTVKNDSKVLVGHWQWVDHPGRFAKQKFHCLYHGHDMETAQEIYDWAIKRGLPVRLYKGREAEEIFS